jgi:cytosine/adenosine deaminase-related metal-dependent hydrolase
MNRPTLIRTPRWVDGHGTRRGDFAILVEMPGESPTVTAIDHWAALATQGHGATVMRADAVAPRLVNAHTHLDLSSYPRMMTSFPEFLAAMVAHRRSHPQARGLPAARDGMRVLRDQRVAAVGDIVAREAVLLAELSSGALPGVAYWEVISPHQSASAAALVQLKARLRHWRQLQQPGAAVLGLAPQSPYLVCRDMLQALARLSLSDGLPLQIHVAESPAELEFFRTGSGALAQVLSSIGFAHPPGPGTLGVEPHAGLTPIRYLAEIGFLDASPTLVHCVNVSDDDIRLIARHRCPVVTCPRSNANLDCGVFPWKKFVEAGVSIALATDSSVSAHSLDLGLELATAFDRYGDGFDLGLGIEWLTTGASRALRRPIEVIQPGCRLDALTLVNLRVEPS